MAPHSSTLAWKIHGWRSLVGWSPWGRTESDTTEATAAAAATEKSGFRDMRKDRLSWWVGKLVRQACEKRRGNQKILVQRTWCLSWVSNYNKHSQEVMSSRDYIEYDKTSKGTLLNWKTSLETVRVPHVHQWEADETWELGEGYKSTQPTFEFSVFIVIC